MKKVLILGFLAVLIAMFAYFSLFGTSNSDLSRSNNGLQSAQPSNTPPTSQDKLGQGLATLEELRQRGEDLECSISYADEAQQAQVEGKYFVSGGDMRGDFLTDSPDLSGQVLSSMIITGETMYVWSEIEGQAYGVKMDLSLAAEATVETNEPVALDEEVSYDCESWEEVDPTVFVPPASVLFQDMNELIRAGMEHGTIYE